MKSNYKWLAAYLLLLFPVLPVMVIYYLGINNEMPRWFEKILLYYSVPGFFFFFLIFIALNGALNKDKQNRRIVFVISISTCMIWVGYLFFLLLTGEFV